MTIRKLEEKDIDQVMKIVQQAKEYFRHSGIDQWQHGYPYRSDFEKDREEGIGWVVEEQNEIKAYCAISFEPEPAYAKIFSGKWPSDDPYVSIHRTCVSAKDKGHGYAGKLFAQAGKMAKEKGLSHLRVDTHADNHSMIRAVEKSGFKPCGTIFVHDIEPRIGFDKEL